jgi:hypothetical protein
VGGEAEDATGNVAREAIGRRERIETIVKAIVNTHPYETPAIALYPTLTGEHKYWKEESNELYRC